MALDAEDITNITKVVNDANKQLFDRVSEKLELTVSPVKENLVSHISHDEDRDKSFYEALDALKIGQATLKQQMRVSSWIGGIACTGLAGLFFGVIKDLI